MKMKLLNLADELAEKLNQLATFQIALASIKDTEEQLKIALFKEAKGVEGVKTVADKENYVKEQMFDKKCYTDRNSLNDKITNLDAEIKGLNYKFRAMKTILEVKE